jgi:hypothetical protein
MNQSQLLALRESFRPTSPVVNASHFTRPRPRASGAADVHDDFREGARIGLIVAATTWLWIALIDMIVGQPFHTFHVLGGVAGFTVMHCVLNVAYGVAIVSTVHAATRLPSLIYLFGFGLLFLEIVFVFATVALSNFGLGDLAWIQILGGSLLGASVAATIVARHHPLAELLRAADVET